MDIAWLGKKSFRISDELVDVIINPDNNDIDSSTFTENTVLISTDANREFQSSLTVVDSPGEYEVNNLSIFGVANAIVNDQSKRISTCYKLESRGLSVAVIGMIGSSFDSEALSVLSSSNIVIFSPDNTIIDSEMLANTIRSLDTKKIIISGYDKNTTTPSKSLESIIKVLGIKDFEPKNKVSVTLSNLGDVQEIIILEN
jgi:hypothetical protein|tara:strand:- start:7210 stop:7809 length:600 start_codon:yes stop_codon:yes gene_type:complete